MKLVDDYGDPTMTLFWILWPVCTLILVAILLGFGVLK